MPKLVLVEQFFFPEGWAGAQFPRDISISLAESGFDVEVICGSDQYAPIQSDDAEDPALSGVRIRRVPKIIPGADIHSKKLLRQVWFYAASLPLLLFRRSPDLFITQTNPPFVVILVAIAAIVHRRPFALIAMDLYPEVLFAHKVVSETSLFGRILSLFFGWAYRRAERVVALGPTMQKRLESRGVARGHIRVISNWATGDESVVRGDGNRLVREWDLQGCTVFLYSGNLGVAHDFETPIHAFEIARRRCPDIRLVFVGKGTRLADAKRLASRRGLNGGISFHPLVPSNMLPQSLGVASVAVVTLRKGFEGLVVPSKLLGYMARKIPTVYVGPPSDAEAIIAESGGGVAFSPGDVEALADFMVASVREPEALDRMGQAALSYYSQNLCRDIGLRKYRQLVEEICSRGGRPR